MDKLAVGSVTSFAPASGYVELRTVGDDRRRTEWAVQLVGFGTVVNSAIWYHTEWEHRLVVEPIVLDRGAYAIPLSEYRAARSGELEWTVYLGEPMP